MKKIFTKKTLLEALVVVVLSLSLMSLLQPKKEVEIVDDELVTQKEYETSFQLKLTDGNYSLEEPFIVLDPYQVSPLTALVAFKTENLKEIQVTVLGKDENSTFVMNYPENTEHYLSIYGLYPDYENIIELSDGVNTKTIKIQTNPLEDDFILPTTAPVANKEKLNAPLYLLSPAASGKMAGYDVNGDVRWFLNKNYAWDIKILENGHLLIGSERLINSPYYTVGLKEIDLTGKIYHEYIMPGGYHHDVYEMDDGNLLVATSDFSRGSVEDLVVLIDRNSGAVIKSWDVKSVLPTDQGKSENWIEHDWFHNNSVYYDKFNDAIILSGRHQDAVISLDFKTGALNWILGDPTSWDETMQKYFLKPISDPFEYQWSQHAAKITADGKLLLFDNGNNKSKIKEEYVAANDSYSRAVIYEFDQGNKTVKQIFQYGKERGSIYYSPYISEADELSENHYLIHSGGIAKKDGNALNQPGVANKDANLTSITTELLNNEVIFELTLPSNYYRAEKIEFNNLAPLTFQEGRRSGSMLETLESEKEIKVWPALKYLPKKYQLSLKQETDRLVVSGSFKKGSEVYIVLKQADTLKTYQITVSKTPYTAMCIGIFNQDNEDENIINLNYYINQSGLSGKYDIYIKINKIVYNTKQYVEFK